VQIIHSGGPDSLENINVPLLILYYFGTVSPEVYLHLRCSFSGDRMLTAGEIAQQNRANFPENDY
jgi:hypothetical protein